MPEQNEQSFHLFVSFFIFSTSVLWIFRSFTSEVPGEEGSDREIEKEAYMYMYLYPIQSSQVTQCVKNLPVMKELQGDVFDSWSGRCLEKGMASHSSILAWETPWTGDSGRAIVHGVAKSQTLPEATRPCIFICLPIYLCICLYRHMKTKAGAKK